MSTDHLRAPPAYQHYPGELALRDDYQLMTLAERGLLVTLRDRCWVNGSIPEDLARLARMTGFPEEQIASNLTPRVRSFFAPGDTAGSLICPELVDQRERMDFRSAERARSGKKGAKTKWGKARRGMAEPMAEPLAEPMAEPLPRARPRGSIEEQSIREESGLAGKGLKDLVVEKDLALKNSPAPKLKPDQPGTVDAVDTDLPYHTDGDRPGKVTL